MASSLHPPTNLPGRPAGLSCQSIPELRASLMLLLKLELYFIESSWQPNQEKGLIELAQSCGTHWHLACERWLQLLNWNPG